MRTKVSEAAKSGFRRAFTCERKQIKVTSRNEARVKDYNAIKGDWYAVGTEIRAAIAKTGRAG